VSAMYEEIQRAGAAADPSLDGLYAGLIAETAATVADRVEVTLNGFDSTLRIGPCRWMPRLEPHTINVAQGAETTDEFTVARLVLPARGDACLVGFDDQQVPWILVWWPA
jgi:hypothetical protein